MERLFVLYFTVVIALVAGCSRPTPGRIPKASGNLTVFFLDVGQGDATVIISPSGRVVLIDGGGVPSRATFGAKQDESGRQSSQQTSSRDPGARVVVPFLRHRRIERIDLMVATHPDDDHVLGLGAVLDAFPVSLILDSGFPDSPGGGCERLLARARTRGVLIRRARRRERIELGGGAYLETLHPPERFLSGGPSDSNANSIVFRLVYGNLRVLLLADAEENAESELLRSVPELLSADIVKAGHHGARLSTGSRLLRAARPRAVVISCGRDNRYGHPNPQTVDRIRSTSATLFRTDRDGAIGLESDGVQIRIGPIR